MNEALKDYEIIRGDLNDAKNLIQVRSRVTSMLKSTLKCQTVHCKRDQQSKTTSHYCWNHRFRESIVSSAESQVEREKTSIRTRELKLNGWRRVSPNTTLMFCYKFTIQCMEKINRRI